MTTYSIVLIECEFLKLIDAGNYIEIENYAVKQEQPLYGASREPQRLKALKSAQLEKLPGCNMIVEVDWSQL